MGGSRSPSEGAIWGVVWPNENHLGVSATVYATQGIIQSSITARQPIARLPTGRSRITLSPRKICPPPSDATFYQNSLTAC